MRLGVLAKGGADWIGGLYYTHNLIRALSALPEGDRPEIFLITSDARDAGDHREVADCATLRALADHRRGSAAAQVSVADIDPGLLHLIERERIDVLFPCMRSMGRSFPGRWIAWIPDMQHRAHPEFFTVAERRRRDDTFRTIAAEAPTIVLSSEAARADFEAAYPERREGVRVLSFATVPLHAWHEGDPQRTVQRFDLPDRFLMLPNQFWMHKNHIAAFEAVRILRERDREVCLVCTGKPEDPRHRRHGQTLRKWIRGHKLHDHIHVLGLLPRLDQIRLMRAAQAVVQPSKFEGWSTVVEDARALGKVVFLSDIPVHREQAPPGAIFFPPDDPEALADAIEASAESLPPGPLGEVEREALERQQVLIARFASEFMRIAESSEAGTGNAPRRLGCTA